MIFIASTVRGPGPARLVERPRIRYSVGAVGSQRTVKSFLLARRLAVSMKSPLVTRRSSRTSLQRWLPRVLGAVSALRKRAWSLLPLVLVEAVTLTG